MMANRFEAIFIRRRRRRLVFDSVVMEMAEYGNKKKKELDKSRIGFG